MVRDFCQLRERSLQTFKHGLRIFDEPDWKKYDQPEAKTFNHEDSELMQPKCFVALSLAKPSKEFIHVMIWLPFWCIDSVKDFKFSFSSSIVSMGVAPVLPSASSSSPACMAIWSIFSGMSCRMLDLDQWSNQSSYLQNTVLGIFILCMHPPFKVTSLQFDCVRRGHEVLANRRIVLPSPARSIWGL